MFPQVLSSRVFVAVCRGYWDRMAKDVLHFLENRKENMSWVKSASAEMALQVNPAATLGLPLHNGLSRWHLSEQV